VNPRQLEVFHAIMLSPSLTEAARMLNVSQPAVSAILKHMEDQLELRLFERIGGRLVPTPEAEMLFPEVERLFAQLQSVRRITKEIREGTSGFLSVVGNPTLANTLLPRALTRLRKRHPGVRARLESALARQVVDSVARREFDLGLVYGPSADAGTGAEAIGHTTIACAMREDHPLAKLKEIGPAQLSGQDLITFAKGTPIRIKIEEAFRNADCELTTIAEVTYSLTACFIAQEGAGVALIDPLVLQTGAFPNLMIRPFRPEQQVQILLLYPKNRPRSRLSTLMGELLREMLAEEAPEAPSPSEIIQPPRARR
jgi:DNA-binding transcriptional LysR family regulator